MIRVCVCVCVWVGRPDSSFLFFFFKYAHVVVPEVLVDLHPARAEPDLPVGAQVHLDVLQVLLVFPGLEKEWQKKKGGGDQAAM